jgi:hypothetical protein
MSNFLTHLFARASQQAPVLARRQPALFEPVASTPPLTESIGWSDSPSMGESPPRPSIVRATHEEVAPAPVRVANATLGTARPSESPEFPAKQSMAPSFSATARLESATPATSDEITTKVVHMAAAAKPVSNAALADSRRIPRTEPQTDRHAVRVDSSVAVQRSPAPIAEALPSRPRISDERDTAVHNSAIKNDRHQDTPTSVLTPARPQNTQALQLAKTAQSYAATAAAKAVTAATESVQITIGRVEVRAVAAAERPATRAAKPATTQLTLDDYLRQRSGGRR